MIGREFFAEDEIDRAKADVEIARQNFENAEDEYIDVAIYELAAAEKRLSAIIKEIKNM